MDPEDRDKIVLRLLATWPNPKMADSQRLVWYEHLAKMSHPPAAAALLYLEKNSDHRPSIAKFHEAYAAQHHTPEHALPAPECQTCDDGWIQTRCGPCNCGDAFHQADTSVYPTGRCPHGPGTAARCPNGCMPLSASERESRIARQDDQWKRDRVHREQVALDLRVDRERDFTAPNRDEPF